MFKALLDLFNHSHQGQDLFAAGSPLPKPSICSFISLFGHLMLIVTSNKVMSPVQVGRFRLV